MEQPAKRIRRRCGISREEVAAHFDVSPATVKYWETTDGALRLDTAVELCKLYGCTLDELSGTQPIGQLADTSTFGYRMEALDLTTMEQEKTYSYAEGLKAARP